MNNPSDILLLANLVKDCEKQRRGVDYSSSDEDEASNQKSNLNPGSIGIYTAILIFNLFK